MVGLCNNISNLEGHVNAFELIQVGTKKKRVLATNSVADKRAWLRELNSIVENSLKKAKKG